MQSLASYSFSAELGAEDAIERVRFLEEATEDWLRDKGVTDLNMEEGDFRSLTGDGSGHFKRRVTKSSVGYAVELRLVETTNAGQIFSTEIYFLSEGGVVYVYSKLSITGGDGVVAPIKVYPRCPKVIRHILTSFDDWMLGGRHVPLGAAEAVIEEKDAMELCEELLSPERNLPIVVISIDNDASVWKGLPAALAKDLIGLAHVVEVGDDASWVMTDELGQFDSCYLGAVRLYWPLRSDSSQGLRGTVWTAARQAKFGSDRSGMLRFISQVRGTVMAAAAQTLTAPQGLRNVHAAAFLARLKQMGEEFRDKELSSIVEENYNLTKSIEFEKSKNQDLTWENDRLKAQLRVAEFNLAGAGSNENDQEDEEDEDRAPSQGELRYYKKTATKGGVDVMVRTSGRNHPESAWRPAHRADQAEKGIAKLEGRNDWQSIFHCGSCTGGGHWRVRW